MSDAAYAYRPGMRPAGPSSRPDNPRLHVVPDPALQPETEIGDDAPSITSPQVNDHAVRGDPVADFTFSARISRFWTASKDYWTPPAIFTEAAPSLADLSAYAKTAPWTHQHTGLLRTLGVGYYRAVGYPYTVWSRYKEHVLQRPGRLIVHLGLLKVASLTGPGDWVVHTVVYPVAQFAGHLFL